VKIVPTLVLSVPYSAQQTKGEAERNIEAVRWARHALAQLGFNTITPIPESVHFQVAGETSGSLSADEWRDWCREAMKQQIMYGLVHGTVILYPDAKRCPDSQVEISAAKKASAQKGNWVFDLKDEDGLLTLPNNLMELHKKFVEQQDYC